MATTIASRYAVLSVDVDDDYSNRKKKNSNKKPAEPKPPITTTATKSDTNIKKKKKPENAQAQNGKTRNKSSSSGGNSKKKKEPTAEQWEEWKQKDAQFVEGNYEEDLTQAILLSKLDYEEKKDFYDAMKKPDDDNKKMNNKRNKKGHKVMSLDEFNNLGSTNSREESPSISTDTEKMKEDAEFFEKIKEEAKKEISKEHLAEKKKVRPAFSQEAFTLAQYEDTLEKRDREVAQLKEEIIKLKDELRNVKTRNKQLCQILAHGEMKDKAEVLMEVERLQSVKDELSTEVSSLHAQLEQERSRVRALTGEHKSKDKNKKRTVSSGDTAQ